MPTNPSGEREICDAAALARSVSSIKRRSGWTPEANRVEATAATQRNRRRSFKAGLQRTQDAGRVPAGNQSSPHRKYHLANKEE